ncbi:MAG: metallophosphoesterase [Bdellovibrionota bacterium]
MKFASISDLHIKSSQDPSFEILNHFLTYCLEHEITHLALLGDIFDLMIGPHIEYYNNFQHSFDLMTAALNKGVKIYYLEGNHDFHLGGFFKLIGFTKFENFRYLKHATRIQLEHKIIYISHGDDLGSSSLGYNIYSRIFLRGAFVGFLSGVAPYKLVTGIGHSWSQHSRTKKRLKRQDDSVIRQKFRDAAQRFWKKKKFDVLIMGHSHLEDSFSLRDGAMVLNNGDPTRHRVCAYVDAFNSKLIPIT